MAYKRTHAWLATETSLIRLLLVALALDTLTLVLKTCLAPSGLWTFAPAAVFAGTSFPLHELVKHLLSFGNCWELFVLFLMAVHSLVTWPHSYLCTYGFPDKPWPSPHLGQEQWVNAQWMPELNGVIRHGNTVGRNECGDPGVDAW